MMPELVISSTSYACMWLDTLHVVLLAPYENMSKKRWQNQSNLGSTSAWIPCQYTLYTCVLR